MYPACLRGPLTAGPDGIRLWKVGGETPSQFIELCARTIPRVGSILDTFFSPSRLLHPRNASRLDLLEHGVEVLLLAHHSQTVRAVLLAMATRTILVGRLASNSPIQGEGFLGAPLCQRSTARPS
jgi:hypothetical protein